MFELQQPLEKLCLGSHFMIPPTQLINHTPFWPLQRHHVLNRTSKMTTERTFIMIKPDAVQRGLIADIIKRFEQKGFKLVAMKFMKVCMYIFMSHVIIM